MLNEGPDLPAPSGRHAMTQVNSTHTLVAGGQVLGFVKAFLYDWEKGDYIPLDNQRIDAREFQQCGVLNSVRRNEDSHNKKTGRLKDVFPCY